MLATAVLRGEHNTIQNMLDGMERVAWQLERGDHVPPAILNGLVEVLRLFTDHWHHAKEEELFFPLLEKKGLPRNAGPIGVMLSEHEQGRSLIREMEDSAQAYTHGAADAAHRWVTVARRYVALLGGHILKENDVLFPMAERLLTNAEKQELAGAFEKAEEEKMGAGTHQHLHAQIKRLLVGIFQAVSDSQSMIDVVVLNEWDPDVFHRRVLELEAEGYVARRESYRIIPEMDPETGKIIHLQSIELYRPKQEKN